MSDEFKDTFLEESSEWICENYSLDIRFFSIKENGNILMQACSVSLNPLPLIHDNSFIIETDSFVIGQLQKNDMSKEYLIDFVECCSKGTVNVYDKEMALKPDPSLRYYSEMLHTDKWFYNLHLKISGHNIYLPQKNELRRIENELRSSTPPFDGLNDALGWLDLGGLHLLGSRSSEINIWINPPVELNFENCSLINDGLTVCLKAHPDFDTNTAQVAICPIPREHVSSRRQITTEIKWSISEGQYKEGIAEISLKGADSVLIILLINGGTVRRQWLLDANKARNNRQIPVQYFDKELKMARRAVFDLPDSNKFEEGIALLLFMLGFTPAVQLETDSPDLIAYTPGGKLILIECTTRIADFSSKVGKLVDRRGGLEKSLKESSHHSVVYGALICRLPKDQVATSGIDLHENRIILLTKEDLEQGFNLIRNGVDPDKLVEDAINSMGDDETIPFNFDK
ncbi:hypothetical protein [Teredinibacter haidensis]|uniref:hypothetical protein n=1 Tax=Teredinibacter haidensis TaxID=2731755 RepID=UPI000948C5B8|nr:hypothetical protein [Teredinibacter haidensis]